MSQFGSNLSLRVPVGKGCAVTLNSSSIEVIEVKTDGAKKKHLCTTFFLFIAYILLSITSRFRREKLPARVFNSPDDRHSFVKKFKFVPDLPEDAVS